MSRITSVTDVKLPDPDHAVRRKARDAAPMLAFLGVIAVSNGAASGLAWIAVAVLAAVPWASARARVARHHAADGLVARETVAAASHGQRPTALEAKRMMAHGQSLDPGEPCFVDGAPGTLVSFYGDPSAVTSRSVLAWGSPLAWAFTVIANLMFWRHAAKRRRAAAPR